MPDRLAPIELEAWGGLLRIHSLLVRELDDRLRQHVGLAFSDYDVLVRLDTSDQDGVRLSALGEQLLMTSGGVTRLLDRLERRDLVQRRRSAHDGRGFTAHLTPEGRRLLRRARARHLVDVRELFLSQLTDAQQRSLGAIWRHLLGGANPGRDPVTALPAAAERGRS